jgi:hypothetical protein
MIRSFLLTSDETHSYWVEQGPYRPCIARPFFNPLPVLLLSQEIRSFDERYTRRQIEAVDTGDNYLSPSDCRDNAAVVISLQPYDRLNLEEQWTHRFMMDQMEAFPHLPSL